MIFKESPPSVAIIDISEISFGNVNQKSELLLKTILNILFIIHHFFLLSSNADIPCFLQAAYMQGVKYFREILCEHVARTDQSSNFLFTHPRLG